MRCWWGRKCHFQKFVANSFPLLSDPEHELLEKLGAWGEKKLYGKVSVGTIRKTFIFDEEGVCIKVINKVDTKNASSQILPQ